MPYFLSKIKFPLVILPSFVSLELGLSLLTGYIAALVVAGPKSRMRGRIPSFILKFKQYRVHLHHWLTFSSVFGASMALHFSLVHPLLFYGILGGVIAQGILHYEDWHVVVQKIR